MAGAETITKASKRVVRVIAVLALCLSMVLSAFSLSGCANAESEVRAQVDSELNAVKELDDETVNAFLGSLSSSDTEILDSIGLDEAELMRAYFDGFDYSIDSVTVDGDAAQVVITFTCKTSSDMVAAMQAALGDVDIAAAAQSGDLSSIGQAMIDAVRNVGPRQAEPVTVEYQKQDGAWTAGDSAEQAIASIMM